MDDEVNLVRAYRRDRGGGMTSSWRMVARRPWPCSLRTRIYLILCDLMMPGVDGVGVYERLRREQPHLLIALGFVAVGRRPDGASNS